MYNKPTELEANARKLVARAIKRGELVSKPCIECGDPNTIAHHDDYNQPLRVTWLCRMHHVREHNLLVKMARRRLAAMLISIRDSLPSQPPPKLRDSPLGVPLP